MESCSRRFVAQLARVAHSAVPANLGLTPCHRLLAARCGLYCTRVGGNPDWRGGRVDLHKYALQRWHARRHDQRQHFPKHHGAALGGLDHLGARRSRPHGGTCAARRTTCEVPGAARPRISLLLEWPRGVHVACPAMAHVRMHACHLRLCLRVRLRSTPAATTAPFKEW